MENYLVLKDLAIIIIAAKLFGIVSRKLKAPQVVGEILSGTHYWTQYIRVGQSE